MTTNLRLRRGDGRLYLTRRGWSTDDLHKRWRWIPEFSWFGIYIHHITAPDPGPDLHDHPWPFVSIILKGWYVEQRCKVSEACQKAARSTQFSGMLARGDVIVRRWSDVRRMRLDECHMITYCHPNTWSLVIRGRKRPQRKDGEYWGFYPETGYVPEGTYDRIGARDLWNEAE